MIKHLLGKGTNSKFDEGKWYPLLSIFDFYDMKYMKLFLGIL